VCQQYYRMEALYDKGVSGSFFAGYAKVEVADDSSSPVADDSSPVLDDNLTEGNLLLDEKSSSCPSTPKPEPFDPFTGLTFSPAAEEESTPALYSSFHCVGAGHRDPALQTDAGSVTSRRPNFVSRSCWYRNLYYRHADQTFHYFSSPAESNLWTEDRKAGDASFQELASKMDVSIDHVDDTHKREFIENNFAAWRPNVHENEQAPSNVTSVVGPKEAVFLLYRPFHDRNIGHFVWDTLLSLYSLLDLFGVGSDDSLVPVPFFVEIADTKRRKNYGGYDGSWRCSPWNHAK
jgi:hypothetical protein